MADVMRCTPPLMGYAGHSSPPQSGKRVIMSSQPSVSGSRPSTALPDLTDAGGIPVPDYLRPLINSANKRWKKNQEGNMMSQIVRIRLEKKESKRYLKVKAMQVARKIPMEILGKDWLLMQRSTIETRAYLVGKLLPFVVLGVEKLLMEVDARGLALTTKPDPNFNPLNFLAQYLMRNNPKYSNFTEASPYMRSVRQVAEQLKNEILNYDDNRLARLKADAKRRQEGYEAKEQRRLMERERRMKLLSVQFREWGVGLSGRVEVALLTTAMLSFAEITDRFPVELKSAAAFNIPPLPPDEFDKLLDASEFTEFILNTTDQLPSDIFDQLVGHLTKCAMAYQDAGEESIRRKALIQLFNKVDRGNVGLLDRHRVLSLLENFYDDATELKQMLRNPRKWPVVQLDEEASSEEESEESDVNKPKRRKTHPVKTETKVITKSELELLEDPHISEKQEDENHDEKTVEVSDDVNAADETVTSAEIVNDKEAIGDQATPEETDTMNEDKVDLTESAVDVVKTDEDKAELVETAVDDDQNVVQVSEVDIVKETVEEDQEKMQEDEESRINGEVKQDDVEGKAEDAGEENTTEIQSVKPVTSVSSGTLPGEIDLEVESREDKDVDAGTDIQKIEFCSDSKSAVSFADGICGEKTQMSVMSRSQSQATTFNEDSLNESQFVQMTETFLGEAPHPVVVHHLIKFIGDGYVETEEERLARIHRAALELRSVTRKKMADILFDKWDNDGSGYLKFKEVEPVVMQYKGGMEEEALKKAKRQVRKSQKHQDSRMTKKEFRFFLNSLSDLIPGDDSYECLVEFLLVTVVRTYQQRIRGEARKKWLAAIRNAALTCGANMEPVFRAVFQALYKDAETHGGGKRINANISLIERNDVTPSRGPLLLRYVACTPADAEFLIGQTLFPDMAGISFSVVESGNPIHVPKVSSHGNVHFWNPDHNDELDGAFVLVPLKDRGDRVFGLLGLDTLGESEKRNIFVSHEIHFFQGVAKAFSIAYHEVDIRHKTMVVAESALAWLHRRCVHCSEITLYMVEPDIKTNSTEFVLRKMLVTDDKGMPKPLDDPPRLERKDNPFRDYLFKCVDTSESVSADAYGERHLAFPLRNKNGLTASVLDIGIGSMKQLSPAENKEMVKMLKLLQFAHLEILKHADEGSALDSVDVTVMFDKLMLEDLKENIRKLDSRAYAELKSYHDPPKMIHLIIRAVLSILYPDKALEGDLEEWGACKQLVGVDLCDKIMDYDPTTVESIVPAQEILAMMDDVSHDEVSCHVSTSAQHLYNWVIACLSLHQHTHKMKAQGGDELSSENSPRSEEGEPTTEVQQQSFEQLEQQSFKQLEQLSFKQLEQNSFKQLSDNPEEPMAATESLEQIQPTMDDDTTN